MAQTAADAEIIGVINADYVVDPHWLKDLVPAFADPEVGLIQALQVTHRPVLRNSRRRVTSRKTTLAAISQGMAGDCKGHKWQLGTTTGG